MTIIFITSFPQPRAHVLLKDSPLFHSTSKLHYIQLSAYCLPYIRLPKNTNKYTFPLKIASAMFDKMSETLNI
jgi:hypothetical protein